MNPAAKNLFYLLLILLLFSCRKEEDEVTIYNHWQFVSLESQDADPPFFNPVPEDLEIRVLFSRFGIVTVQSYCNEGSGSFSARGADLTISSLAMTEKYCYIDEPLDWEAVFIFNFERSQYYLIEEKTLTILTEGDYHLNFKKVN